MARLSLHLRLETEAVKAREPIQVRLEVFVVGGDADEARFLGIYALRPAVLQIRGVAALRCAVCESPCARGGAAEKGLPYKKRTQTGPPP